MNYEVFQFAFVDEIDRMNKEGGRRLAAGALAGLLSVLPAGKAKAVHKPMAPPAGGTVKKVEKKTKSKEEIIKGMKTRREMQKSLVRMGERKGTVPEEIKYNVESFKKMPKAKQQKMLAKRTKLIESPNVSRAIREREMRYRRIRQMAGIQHERKK
jgi:hypothetical protein